MELSLAMEFISIIIINIFTEAAAEGILYEKVLLEI